MSARAAVIGALKAKHLREMQAALRYAPPAELYRFFSEYGQPATEPAAARDPQLMYYAPAPPRNSAAPPMPSQPSAAIAALDESQSEFGWQSDCTVVTTPRCFFSFSPPPAQIDHRSTPYRHLFQIDRRSTPDRRQIDPDIRLIVDRNRMAPDRPRFQIDRRSTPYRRHIDNIPD